MGVNPLVLVGTAVLGIGVLLHIVGMATPVWSVSIVSDDYSVGPFKSCLLTMLGQKCSTNENVPSEYKAVQAMTIIGVLFGGVALAVSVLIFVFSLMGKSQHKMMPLLAVGASFGSFFFILLGVIIWGAAIHDDISKAFDIGYSFILSIVGGVLVVVGGLMVFIGGRGSVSS
ncbi:uncharacterized protein LOC101863642 [Aplysia californica]|uniref:Uncharacterized protein LOC101863642 n=1 Tax=Aplysia californica TaxID=6500 RepID=A0ABM0KAM5_APLCA|nr:uncharacterized protein LOC101863642 [Aplysia californica]